MQFIKFFALAIVVLLIGGFGYIAFTDVKIQQQETVKEIPNERLIQE